MNVGRLYTKEDDNIIKKYYPILTNREVARMLDRPLASVRDRANRIGVKKLNPPRQYSKEEIEIVKECFPILETAEISKMLGRSQSSIRHKARKLRLTKVSKEGLLYTEEELEFLINNYNKIPLEQQSKKLGRTTSALSQKLRELGIWEDLLHKPVGSERIDSGYVLQKQEDGEWRLKHRVVWEKHHGEIPDKFRIHFKDGNTTNTDIENLELISFAESMRKYSWARYPHELRKVIARLNRLERVLDGK